MKTSDDPLSHNQNNSTTAAPRQTNIKTTLHNNWRIITIAVCIIIFISLALSVLQGDLMRLDQAAYWLIVEHMRRPWLTPIMMAFSSLATPAVLLCSLLLVAGFAQGRRPATACTINLLCVLIINITIKAIIQRPRPDGFRLAVEYGFSFPSGHSMVAMGFFGLIVWLIMHSNKDRKTRLWVSSIFCFLILMIGISRVYLGVHYASDVIAGFCVSIVWLALFTRIAMPAFLDSKQTEKTPHEVSSSSCVPKSESRKI